MGHGNMNLNIPLMSTQNEVGTFDENILLFLDFREKAVDFLSYSMYIIGLSIWIGQICIRTKSRKIGCFCMSISLAII